MSDIRFYDTSSLLLSGESLFKKQEPFLISSITLKELENIKTSGNKDIKIKYLARQTLRLLEQYPDHYIVVVHSRPNEEWIRDLELDITNDTMILSDAITYDINCRPDEVIFVTNDLSLKAIANLHFGDGMIESVEQEEDSYTGVMELTMTDEEMAEFYSSDPYNYNHKLGAYINQYINIYTTQHERVDTLRWSGEEFKPLKYRDFSSQQLGTIKPIKGDIYQAMVADSLMNNQLTMIKGPAGSGKTTLALGYLFFALEKHQIDKIVIFCNTVATKYAAKLGYYPGTRDEKLLDSQIGNLLASKLGGRMEVERLIDEEKLLLLPMSDIRGYDTTGMNAGIYIPEAQNLNVELLKLAIQRVGSDSFMILDGDVNTQVDLAEYEGSNNGMRRASQVFRGTDVYGEITLKNIHRSRLAEIAEQM